MTTLADLLSMQQDNSGPGGKSSTGQPTVDSLTRGRTEEEINALLSGMRISTPGFEQTFGHPSATPMPQNFLRNESTGKVYDLGLSRQAGPAVDYASPVEIVGYGKGYRVKGDPFTAIMQGGRIIKLGADTGADTGADRKRMVQDLDLQLKQQSLAGGQIEQQIKLGQLADMNQPMPNQGQTAAALGVPAAPPMYPGMSRKAREALQSKEVLQSEKRIAEQEVDARNQGVMAQDAERFKTLNESTDTGPIIGSAPVAWMRGLMDDNVQEMRSISDRLTPKMREPGSGATSDFDARMFQSALFGVNKNKGANDAIATAMIARAKSEKDRVAFNQAYLQANNTLQGADAQWQKYAADNPIFDPSSPGVPKINAARKNWRSYFSREQQAVTVRSEAEAMQLPSGTRFVLNGRVGVKE